MWSSRAGRIATWLALGAAVAGCGEKRLDVCKAARGGGAPHSVELAESTFTKPARPFPVVTIAPDGIYLDARPLLASWPEDRCEKLARKIAPRDQPSLAEEQLIFGLKNFTPASPEAERLGMLRLGKAVDWTRHTLNLKYPEPRGFNLRVDKRAPSGLVQQVLSPALFNAEPWFIVANAGREMALARDWVAPGYSLEFFHSCQGLAQVVEVHKQGLSISECGWPFGPLHSCRCALAATVGVPDKLLHRILDVPLPPMPAICKPIAPRVTVAASSNAPWARWVAMYTRLHHIGAPAVALAWTSMPKQDCAILLTPSGPILPSPPGPVPPWCNLFPSPLHPPGLVCPSTGYEDRIDEIGRLVTQ